MHFGRRSMMGIFYKENALQAAFFVQSRPGLAGGYSVVERGRDRIARCRLEISRTERADVKILVDMGDVVAILGRSVQ